MPVGLFRSEEGWVQVDYGTGCSIPIPDTSPISINCRQKRSIGAAENKKEDDAKRP
jgi:hypothetical protein